MLIWPQASSSGRFSPLAMAQSLNLGTLQRQSASARTEAAGNVRSYYKRTPPVRSYADLFSSLGCWRSSGGRARTSGVTVLPCFSGRFEKFRLTALRSRPGSRCQGIHGAPQTLVRNSAFSDISGRGKGGLASSSNSHYKSAEKIELPLT